MQKSAFLTSAAGGLDTEGKGTHASPEQGFHLALFKVPSALCTSSRIL